MPILHQQFAGEAQDSEGNRSPLNPSRVLQMRGPVLQVTVSLAENVATQLLDRGDELPTPIPGLGLIDTGATATCIDDTLAQNLGLPVIDRGVITSASHEDIPVNIYPALIVFVGANIRINVERAAGVALASQGLAALIGRDVLQRCTMFYNGLTGAITLSM